MTTILPLNKVVQITDARDKRWGYGLEVRPAVGAPAQHWLLFADHLPAKRKGEPMLLPLLTSWQVTNDARWRDATTVDDFLELAGEEIARPGTGTIYATAKYANNSKQPDVGGFWMYQRETRVGRVVVTYNEETNIYQEAWSLGGGFNTAEGFAFEFDQTLAVESRPEALAAAGADRPDYLTTVRFDVQYYQDALP